MRRNPIEVELTDAMIEAVAHSLMINFEESAFDEQDYKDIAKEAIDAFFGASREIREKGSLYGRIELPSITGFGESELPK